VSPESLLYTETHEWVHVDESSSIATLGITAHAVEQLTDLVYMELPEIGRTVSAGEAVGEVESVKATSDLYSPLAGEVVEVNSGLPDNLDVLNTDPYGEGWILKMKIDGADLSGLMDHAAYMKQCSEEG
jgi:glycine cleavage system H protein